MASYRTMHTGCDASACGRVMLTRAGSVLDAREFQVETNLTARSLVETPARRSKEHRSRRWSCEILGGARRTGTEICRPAPACGDRKQRKMAGLKQTDTLLVDLQIKQTGSVELGVNKKDGSFWMPW